MSTSDPKIEQGENKGEEKGEVEKPIEEAEKEPLNPEGDGDKDKEKEAEGGGGDDGGAKGSTLPNLAALTRSISVARKLKNISTEKPPTKNPLGYLLTVFGKCFAGITVGLGVCCCVGTFMVLEVIPITAIVIGFTYWDRDRYCTADNIPFLLVIGGILKVLHLTLASAAGRERSNARKYVDKLASRKVKKGKKKGGQGGQEDLEKGGEDELDPEDITKLKEQGEEVEIDLKDEQVRVEQGDSEEQAEEKGPSSGPPMKPWFRLVNSLLFVAELTWFITATVVIFGLCPRVEYRKSVDTIEDYCHQTLFRFAVFYISLIYVVLGLVVIIPLTMWCCGLLSLLIKD